MNDEVKNLLNDRINDFYNQNFPLVIDKFENEKTLLDFLFNKEKDFEYYS